MPQSLNQPTRSSSIIDKPFPAGTVFARHIDAGSAEPAIAMVGAADSGGAVTLKARQIVKRAIVSLSEPAEVGYLDNIVFDREARVAALVFRRRVNKRELASTAIDNVCAVGRDAVTIVDSERIEGEERLEELSSAPNLRQLLRCRVITEGGTYLGTVRDVLLDPEERRITDFELRGRGVWGRLRGDLIPASGHLRFGTELLIVPNVVTLKGRATLREIEQPAKAATGKPPAIVLPETSIMAFVADEPGAGPQTAADEQISEESLTRAA